MRTTSIAIVAAVVGVLTAGTAIADSPDPNNPAAPRRNPAPAATPDFAPGPGARPTAPFGEPQVLPFPNMTAGGTADTAVDRILGVLPGPEAAKEHAKIYIVNDAGEIECWDLDTFFPEPC